MNTLILVTFNLLAFEISWCHGIYDKSEKSLKTLIQVSVLPGTNRVVFDKPVFLSESQGSHLFHGNENIFTSGLCGPVARFNEVCMKAHCKLHGAMQM